MNKKKLLLVTFFVVIMLVSSFGFVKAQQAEGEFADIIEMFWDMLKMFSQIFNFGWMKDNPNMMLGFIFFLIWLLLFTIINIGTRVAFQNKASQNQITIISLCIATITIAMFWIQRDFVFRMLFNWVAEVLILIYLGLMGGAFYFVWKGLGNSPGDYFIKGLICLIMVMLTQAVKVFIQDFVEIIEEAVGSGIYTSLIGPTVFIIYMKLKERKWQ